jgi:peptide/nickel transport system substrate-binding protein
MYRRFQRIFAEQVPALPLYYDVYHYAVSKSVRNVQLGPVLLNPSERFRNVAQWYVKTRRVILNQGE